MKVCLVSLQPGRQARWRVREDRPGAGTGASAGPAAELNLRSVNLVRMELRKRPALKKERAMRAEPAQREGAEPAQRAPADAERADAGKADAGKAAGKAAGKGAGKSRVPSFEDALLQVAEDTACPEMFYSACHHAAAELEELAGLPVVPFGSFVQGTCCESSDLDLALVCPPGHRGVSQLEKLALLAASEASGFVVVEEIYSARVPLLRLRERASGLEVDVSVGDRSADKADRAVAENMMGLDGHEIIVLVKTWARRRCVQGAYGGFLSSYSWTLLCLFALKQQRRTLAAQHPDRRLRVALLAVFKSVLSLAESAPANCAVDAAKGALVARPAGRKKGSRRSMALYIQDLVEPSRNASRCLTPAGWRATVAEARRAARLCEAGGGDGVPKLFQKKGEAAAGPAATGRETGAAAAVAAPAWVVGGRRGRRRKFAEAFD